MFFTNDCRHLHVNVANIDKFREVFHLLVCLPIIESFFSTQITTHYFVHVWGYPTFAPIVLEVAISRAMSSILFEQRGSRLYLEFAEDRLVLLPTSHFLL
jgi:hypothetical protein